MNAKENAKRKLSQNVIKYFKSNHIFLGNKNMQFRVTERSYTMNWCLTIDGLDYFDFTWGDETKRQVRKYIDLYKLSITYVNE
jgi:hypothetical protein